MGWLRDLMLGAGLVSLDDLARRTTAHGDWPNDEKLRARSLAATLGRLDRGEQLDWLTQRPRTQRILAEVLGCTLDDIRQALSSPKSPATHQKSLLRLEELKNARALDLTDEDLPPGIPPDLRVPTSWSRCLWSAPPGSGRTLVREWLARRGLAETLRLNDEAALANLPALGPPLYVEVTHSISNPCLEALLLHRPVCIAVQRIDPAPLSHSPHGFKLLSSPSIESVLSEVLDWVASRLASSARFDKGQVHEWLLAGPVTWGAISTLADVWGFCGLVDELGMQRVAGRDAAGCLSLALRHRTSELVQKNPQRPGGHRLVIPKLLTAMAQACLLKGAGPWMAARSLQDWTDLLPDEYLHAPDAAWLQQQLALTGQRVSASALAQATRRLPPSAFGALTSLRELGLLRTVDGQRFELRPHYLARLAWSVAMTEVAHSSPTLWGEGLLEPTVRDRLLSALWERCATAPETLVEDVLELSDDESPALVSATEATFVTLGLSALAGAEVPRDLLGDLFDEQLALLVWPGNGPPRARIPTANSPSPMDSPGALLLAAWALSELRPRGNRPRPIELDPWQLSSPPASLGGLMDSVQSTLVDTLPNPPAWVPGALALLDRLRNTIGIVELDGEPHPLLCVGLLLDEVEHDVLELTTVKRVREPWQIRLLNLAMHRRGTSQRSLYAALWQSASVASSPRELMDTLQPFGAALLAAAPAERIASWLREPDINPEALPLRDLGREIWRHWAENNNALGTPDRVQLLLTHAPSDVAERLVREGLPLRPEWLEVLWRRWPQATLERLEQERILQPGAAAQLLQTMPETVGPHLIEAAERWHWERAAHPFIDVLRRALHHQVGLRGQNFRDAYAILARVQRALSAEAVATRRQG